ncbi:NTF2-like protein [Neolentinus lepideus HHB14362 ss-1]|uniref:NTF2-like protein n=1 Tax=Neolentinus lepideus HHB14362 ss-1 TaxID=1314782 RepID=A0A165W3J3_9AGAM|nr:NTF2-like protein [Neolentinus lepideus HHB14362 ss-1]
MASIYPNAVTSTKFEPPLLLLVLPEEHSAWCSQFAEEGYSVIHVPYSETFVMESLDDPLQNIAKDITRTDWAVVTYALRECDSKALYEELGRSKYLEIPRLKCAIHFSPLLQDGRNLLYTTDEGRYLPTIFHLAASQEKLQASLSLLCTPDGLGYPLPTSKYHPIEVYTYPLVTVSPSFPLLTKPPVSLKSGENLSWDPYVQSATGLSYTRTLQLLRRELGPHFDLERLWEQHTYYEFVERDAPSKFLLHVTSPYVNHIPTMTGGVGYDDLARFYKVGYNVTPPDTEMITVSRTVGADRIIDEMIFKCTHTTEIDWLVPGIKPTGKSLEIALVGVVAFRGDKLTFEYWDQASVLVQLGLIDGSKLPVAGSEVARKAINPFGLASNGLMDRWSTSEGLSID